jgi:hypothetical protein
MSQNWTKEKMLFDKALRLYLDGLAAPNGIGCKQCYACVTGDGRPCLQNKKITKKVTRCKAITKMGKRCKRKPSKGMEYCFGHCDKD